MTCLTRHVALPGLATVLHPSHDQADAGVLLTETSCDRRAQLNHSVATRILLVLLAAAGMDCLRHACYCWDGAYLAEVLQAPDIEHVAVRSPLLLGTRVAAQHLLLRAQVAADGPVGH